TGWRRELGRHHRRRSTGRPMRRRSLRVETKRVATWFLQPRYSGERARSVKESARGWRRFEDVHRPFGRELRSNAIPRCSYREEPVAKREGGAKAGIGRRILRRERLEGQPCLARAVVKANRIRISEGIAHGEDVGGERHPLDRAHRPWLGDPC